MKKIALILILSAFIFTLFGCATPYLDRLMYEDQISANQRNYVSYRLSMEYFNQDKVKAGDKPVPILPMEEWVRSTERNRYVDRYESIHPK